ncbi:MAG: hypothetical protein II517_03990 [Ruminococcus sp.]|nr:hypothetical protein [Ruminococcus sp.]
MSKSALVNIAKGVAVGMVAGAVVGYAGKYAADENPKIRKKITRVKRTANDVADTAKYMFK